MGYGLQGNQNARTYECYFTDTEQFIREACGYPTRIPTGLPGPGAVAAILSRRPPIRDPQFPWLTASRASNILPYGAMLGNIETPYGSFAEYEYSRVTILFEAADYDIIDDGTLQAEFGGNEVYRWTSWHWEYGGQMITRAKGSFIFKEGQPGFENIKFAMPKAFFEAHNRFVLRWSQLPEIGIMNSNKILNTNIRQAKGKVNQNDWPVAEASGGFAAGTLLCEDIKVTPSMAPASPLQLGLHGFQPPRTYDLDLVIDYFDPAIGTGTGGGAYPAPTTRGHNTFPWSLDNYYYFAAAKGPGATPLYAGYDFNQIFVIS
jgi:hypothetical protein